MRDAICKWHLPSVAASFLYKWRRRASGITNSSKKNKKNSHSDFFVIKQVGEWMNESLCLNEQWMAQKPSAEFIEEKLLQQVMVEWRQ